jgi:hypothetical protein
MAGIAATFGSSPDWIGHGSCAHADHCSGDVTPGAQAAWRAIEKRTWFSGMANGMDETETGGKFNRAALKIRENYNAWFCLKE